MNAAPTSDEITAYALGELPAARAREIEAMAREDEDLRATMHMMRALIGQEGPAATRRGGWPSVRIGGVLAAALLAALTGGGYFLLTQLAVAKEARTRAEAGYVRVNRDLVSLKPAQAIIDAAEPTDGQLQAIAFLPADKSAAVDTSGTVHVTVENVTFPCILKWKVGDETRTIAVPAEGLRAELPSGEARITCDPEHTHSWFQPFGIVHEGTYLGSTVGASLLKVKSGDSVRIHLDQPYPPWNATMVRVRGEWIIVTLDRPSAQLDVQKFREGRWEGEEALPNTPLFYADVGSEGLARELARYFIEHRSENIKHGKFRGMMHTTLLVPSEKIEVVAGLRTATLDDLIPPLTQAFEALRKQRPPTGLTIQQEIDAAAQLMREGLKPAPKPK